METTQQQLKTEHSTTDFGYEQHIKRLQNMINQEKAEKEKLAKELLIASSTTLQGKDDVLQVTRERADLTLKVDSLQKQLTSAKEETEIVTRELQSAKRTVESVKAEAKTEIESHLTQVRELRTKLFEEVSKVQNQTLEYTALQSKLGNEESKVRVLTEDRDRFQALSEEQQKQLNESKRESFTLSSKLLQISSEKQQLENTIGQLTNDAASRNQELDKQGETISEYREIMDKLKKMVEQERTQNSQKDGENKQLRYQYEGAVKVLSQQRQSQAETRKSLDSLITAISESAAKSEINIRYEQLMNDQNASRTLHSTMEQLEHNKKAAFEFQSKLQEAEKLNAQYQERIEELEQYVSSVQEKLNNHLIRLVPSKNDSRSLNVEVSKESSDQKQARVSGITFEQIQQLQQQYLEQLSQLQAKLDQAIREKEEYSYKLQMTSSQLNDTKSQLQLGESNLQQVNADRASLQSELDSFKVEINVQRSKQSFSDEQLKLVQQALDMERQAKASLQEEIQGKTQIILQEQHEKVELLKGQSSKWEESQLGQFQELREFITTLKQQKEELQRKLLSVETDRMKLEMQLTDAHIIAESLKHQMATERAQKEDLQRLLGYHKDTIEKQLGLEAEPSQLNQNERNLEKQNQELQELIVLQKDENDRLLRERDSMIEQLLAAIKDLSESQQRQEESYTTGIKELAQAHQDELTQLRDRLALAETEKSQLQLEYQSLQEQSRALKEQLDRFEITGQMQNEELERLNRNSSIAGEEIAQVSKQSVKTLTEKVDKLYQSYLEKDREVTVLRNELEVKSDTFKREIASLNEESIQMRDAYTLLRRETDALRENLDQARKTQMMSPDQVESSSLADPSLLLQERLVKAEAENEQHRARFQALNEEFQGLRTQQMQLHVDNIRKEEEIKSIRSQLVQNSFKLRHMEDINQENTDLQAKVTKLTSEIDALRGDIAKKPEEVKGPNKHAIQKQFTEMNAQLQKLLLDNEELKKELSTEAPPNQTIVQVSNSQFRNLYTSLNKARTLLLTMNALLDLGSLGEGVAVEEDLDSIHVGSKRQRTE